MKFNKPYCSFTHGGGESRTFWPGGLCQLLTEWQRQSWQRPPSWNVLLSPPPCVKLQYCSFNFMLIQETQLWASIESRMIELAITGYTSIVLANLREQSLIDGNQWPVALPSSLNDHDWGGGDNWLPSYNFGPPALLKHQYWCSRLVGVISSDQSYAQRLRYSIIFMLKAAEIRTRSMKWMGVWLPCTLLQTWSCCWFYSTQIKTNLLFSPDIQFLYCLIRSSIIQIMSSGNGHLVCLHN